MKITKALILFVTLVIIIVLGLAYLKEDAVIDVTKINPEQNDIEFCFFSKQAHTNSEAGLYDKQVLTFKLSNPKKGMPQTATGTYKFLPGEKDSKTGTFVGSVSSMNPSISGRLIDAIWNSNAEGMTNKEELIIQFGEGSAVTFFGAMKEGENGVYVYENKKDVQPGAQMSQTDCANKEISTE